MGMFKDCGCGCNGKKQEQKFIISLVSALLFFIIANPDTFRLMRRILGSWVSGPNGCPTTAGLILHTIVFMLISWGMMNIKKRESYEAPQMPMGPAPMGPAPMGPAPMPEVVEKVEKPPRMADMPSPLPGMSEKSFDFSDSGVMYAPLDINSETDMPAEIKKPMNGDMIGRAVTCSCTDGSKVVITP
jgi:hypothetical protein